MVLIRGQRNNYGFTMVLLKGQRKNIGEEIYDKFGDIYDLYRKKSDDLLDETKIELGHDPFESKTDNLVVDEDDEDRSSKNSSSDEKSLLR